jgi:hypothetical protein
MPGKTMTLSGVCAEAVFVLAASAVAAAPIMAWRRVLRSIVSSRMAYLCLWLSV